MCVPIYIYIHMHIICINLYPIIDKSIYKYTYRDVSHMYIYMYPEPSFRSMPVENHSPGTRSVVSERWLDDDAFEARKPNRLVGKPIRVGCRRGYMDICI